MARRKAPTIAEQGGLKPHLEHLGVDYELFILLDKADGQNNTSIAGTLTEKRGGAKIWPSTVKDWRTVAATEKALHD